MSMTGVNARALLGFNQKEKIIEDEVKKAYKKLALKLHPDKTDIPAGASKAEEERLKEAQKERFQRIAQARDYLLDPENKELGKPNSSAPQSFPASQSSKPSPKAPASEGSFWSRLKKGLASAASYLSNQPEPEPQPQSAPEPAAPSYQAPPPKKPTLPPQQLSLTLHYRKSKLIVGSDSELFAFTIVFNNGYELAENLKKFFTKKSLGSLYLNKPSNFKETNNIAPLPGAIDYMSISLPDKLYRQLNPNVWDKDQREQLIQLHQSVPGIIFQALEFTFKRNPLLSEIDVPVNFFSYVQHSTLQALLRKNLSGIESIEKKRFNYINRWPFINKGLVIGILLSIAAFIVSKKMMWGAGIITPLLGTAAAWYVIGYALHQIFRVRPSGTYDSNVKIKKASPAQREALKAGVEAREWPGYFASYKKYCTYRHFDAFANGLEHAVVGNEYLVNKINKPAKPAP